MRALAILTVKNEAGFLLEWLAHHRACGFTDFLVFSNDCTDGTDAMLDRLAAMGWLTHVRNDGPHPQGPQWTALKLANRHRACQTADWLLFCDIDEFVNIHTGVRTVPALLAALPQAAAIALTWRMFGNAGVMRYADTPVVQSFTRAAPAVLAWPWRAQMFKTLFRRDAFAKLGVHRPRQPTHDPRWFDGSGRELPGMDSHSRVFSDYSRDNYGLAQLNHYALGSAESYLVKCDRGRANRDASGFDLGYWVERNLCDVEDRSILALDSRALLASLHADADLARLHRAAVAWRHSRIGDLLATEPGRALLGRLMMCPPSRLLTTDDTMTILRHLPGAASRGRNNPA